LKNVSPGHAGRILLKILTRSGKNIQKGLYFSEKMYYNIYEYIFYVPVRTIYSEMRLCDDLK